MVANNTYAGMVDLSDIRENMIDIRKKLRMSSDSMAILCGVSGLTYSRWESGATRSVKKENYEKLLSVLNELRNKIEE